MPSDGKSSQCLLQGELKGGGGLFLHIKIHRNARDMLYRIIFALLKMSKTNGTKPNALTLFIKFGQGNCSGVIKQCSD
jgi:hypothetical protein